jgi:hypothetical protein
MGQDYKDYVFANGGIESQVTPTVNSSPGVLTTVSSIYIATPTTAQTSTQSNPFPGINQAITGGLVAVTSASSTPGGKAGAQ